MMEREHRVEIVKDILVDNNHLLYRGGDDFASYDEDDYLTVAGLIVDALYVPG